MRVVDIDFKAVLTGAYGSLPDTRCAGSRSIGKVVEPTARLRDEFVPFPYFVPLPARIGLTIAVVECSQSHEHSVGS